MKYATILLDLDHTLFDSDASEAAAFAAALVIAGIEESSLHSKTYQDINIALWAAVERGELVPQQVRNLRFEKFAEAFELSVDPRLMADTFVSALAANGELYSGAHDIIEKLSQRVTLAMVTNGLGEVQRARVERLGIEHYFASIVVSAEVGAAKPGKEIFDIVFGNLGHPDKSSVLMVGDSLSSDMRGGSGYGIATCWYNPNGKSAAAADLFTYEISELSELLQFVG
jgi:YjjG family noncanonical pyrimidine nucleotidase